MKYNMLIIVNKPGESPATTSQEYASKRAAEAAAAQMLSASNNSSIFSIYTIISEKGGE